MIVWRLSRVFFFVSMVASCAVYNVSGNSDSEFSGSLAIDSSCSLVNGVYKNNGRATSDLVSNAVVLDGAVFGMAPVKGDTKSVRFDYISSRKILSVGLAGEMVDSAHPSSNNEFSAKCIDGWLEVNLSKSSYVDGTHSESYVLLKMAISEGGNELVIQYNYEILSTSLWFIKSKKVGKDWYFFKKMMKE